MSAARASLCPPSYVLALSLLALGACRAADPERTAATGVPAGSEPHTAGPRIVPASLPVELQDPAARLAAARMEGYFPNPVLISQGGERLRFYDDLVRGKRVVIQFLYSRCSGTCPVTSANLMQVQAALGQRLGRDFFIYSITLDPEHDTPEVLAAHAERAGTPPGWLFLTGAPADIETLRRHLGVYDPDPLIDADLEQHSGMLVLGNEPLGRWCAVPGQLSAGALTRALERVLEP